MNWLQKLMAPRIRTISTGKGKVPEGLWEKCDGCGAVLYGPELENNLMVCPQCGHHHKIRARKRLLALFDSGAAEEVFGNLDPVDPLRFRDFEEVQRPHCRLAESHRREGRHGCHAGQPERSTTGRLRV